MGRSVSVYSDNYIYIDYSRLERQYIEEMIEEGFLEPYGVNNMKDFEEISDKVKMEIYENEGSYFWGMFKEDLIYSIQEIAPSLSEPEKDEWYDREGLVILGNNLCSVVLSEYYGLVSVSIVPTDEEMRGIAQHWINQISPKFYALGNLYRLGTISNGVGVFQRKE